MLYNDYGYPINLNCDEDTLDIPQPIAEMTAAIRNARTLVRMGRDKEDTEAEARQRENWRRAGLGDPEDDDLKTPVLRKPPYDIRTRDRYRDGEYDIDDDEPIRNAYDRVVHRPSMLVDDSPLEVPPCVNADIGRFDTPGPSRGTIPEPRPMQGVPPPVTEDEELDDTRQRQLTTLRRQVEEYADRMIELEQELRRLTGLD